MIVAIQGKVELKEPTFIHINTNGITYKVSVSLNCSMKIDKNEVALHTTYIVKEDSQQLYGFKDKDEKKLFDTVIKINGIGPKVAMAICSTFTPQTFATIVMSKDITSLTKVPGIGAKGASRILVELSGFVVELPQDPNGVDISQAIQALESLGFKKEIARKTLSQCDATSTSNLVKQALKRLQK